MMLAIVLSAEYRLPIFLCTEDRTREGLRVRLNANGLVVKKLTLARSAHFLGRIAESEERFTFHFVSCFAHSLPELAAAT